MAQYRLVVNICLLSLLLFIVIAKRNGEPQLTAEDFVSSIKGLRQWMTTTMEEIEQKSNKAASKLFAALESKQSMLDYKERINHMHYRVKMKMESLKRDIEVIEENMPTAEPIMSSTLNPPTTTRKEWQPPWWGTDKPLPPPPDGFGVALDVTRIAPDEGMYFNPNETEIFDDIRLDTDNAYNVTTGVFIAPVQGVFIVFLQVDSSDEMPSTFELVQKLAISWYTNPYKAIARVNSDMDHGFAFVTIYLSKGDELFVRPASDMGDFTPNVKPGLNTRLSVYCVHEIMPVVWGG